MSGRLVILPKKTYCPWNPSNVERVRRDERLERERIEKEQRLVEEEDRRRKSNRRNQSDAGRQTSPEEREAHVNLFPEAEEAEKRLFHGGVVNGIDVTVEKSENKGVLQIPLGGEEAKTRKSGKLPFYMRPRHDWFSQGHGHIDNYESVVKNSCDHALRNGIRKRGSVAGDAITSKIMADQFDRREDARKQRMDPMNRFYVDEDITFSLHDSIQPPARYIQQISERCSLSPAMQQTDYDANRIPKSEINEIDVCGVKKRRSEHRERHRSDKSAVEGRKDEKSSLNNSNSNIELLSHSASCLASSSSLSRSDDESSHSRRRSRRRRYKHDESNHRKRSRHQSQSRGESEHRRSEEKHRRKRKEHKDRKKGTRHKESRKKVTLSTHEDRSATLAQTRRIDETAQERA